MNITVLFIKPEKDEGPPALESPSGQLEMMYIEEYLHSQGYSIKKLSLLPMDQARRLRSEACLKAALKLAEVETRAHFIWQLHG